MIQQGQRQFGKKYRRAAAWSWSFLAVYTATALFMIGMGMRHMFDGLTGDMLWSWGAAGYLFLCSGRFLSEAVEAGSILDTLVVGAKRDGLMSLVWGSSVHRTHDVFEDAPGSYRCECGSQFHFCDIDVIAP